MHHALNDENISDLGEPDVANRVIKKTSNEFCYYLKLKSCTLKPY